MLIPIIHYKVLVGHAVVDNDLNLDPSIKWRITIPVDITQRKHQPHVLVQLLREHPTVLPRCTPKMSLDYTTGYDLVLAKVVLRPEIVPLLNEIVQTTFRSPRKEALIYEVTQLAKSVVRYVNLDRNRMNCQRENLREIVEVSPEELLNPE